MKLNYLVLVCLVLSPKPAYGDLESFVTEKLKEFPAWLQAHGLDPFPFNSPEPTVFKDTIRGVKFHVMLYHFKLNGISISPSAGFSHGDLDCGYFYVNCPFAQTFSASGTHSTDIPEDPFHANGDWTVLFNRRCNQYVLEFRILPSGHMEIFNIDKDQSVAYTYPADVYLEGITDSDRFEESKKELTSMLRSNLAYVFEDLDSQLATKAFGRFWDEIFSDITAQDIIDHVPSLPRKSNDSKTGSTAGREMNETFHDPRPQPKQCSHRFGN